LLRAMLFIDGTWLYANTPKLRYESGDRDFQLGYGRLPAVLGEAVGRQLGIDGLDLVRVHIYGSVADNFDPLDSSVVERRREFFEMLRTEYHYEVAVFPVNFRGKRVRREDRPPDDSFEPKEKCVDIALAAALVYHAALPDVYDLGIVVIGDRDYAPALQCARRLGKRIAIVSIRGCCSRVYLDPADDAGVRDAEVVWINDHLDDLELRMEPQLLTCESPDHGGDERGFYTTFRPRRGQQVFCDACRAKRQREIEELQRDLSASIDEDVVGPLDDSRRLGVVSAVKYDNGYGFVVDDEGRSYFFHITGLSGVEFERLTVGTRLLFRVKGLPSSGRAGAAIDLEPAPETGK